MKKQLENIEIAKDEFREIILKSKLRKVVYKDGWTAKEIVAHVVAWNDYYAHTLTSLSNGKTPSYVTESLAKVNQAKVNEYSKFSREKLLQSLERSTKRIIENAPKVKTERIIYKVGAKDYTLDEYLQIVWKHMNKHTIDLRRALKR